MTTKNPDWYKPTPWKCEWCEYMNTPEKQVCEICGERSFVRAANLCNDVVKFQVDTSGAQKSESHPAESKVDECAKETMLAVPMEETKDYNKPTTNVEGLALDTHVCFRDSESIYCLICQMPMLFAFARDIKYPDGFPTQFFDRISLLEKTFTDDAYVYIILKLNGGPISGANKHTMFTETALLYEFETNENPMQIQISISRESSEQQDFYTYSGPSKDAMSDILTAAAARNKVIVLPVVIQNYVIDDRIDMFIAIFPNGNIYCIDITLGACPYPKTEMLLTMIFEGVKNKINHVKSFFISNKFWSRTCAKQSSVYIDFTRSPKWTPILTLIMMSMLSIGMSIKDTVAFLVIQDKQTMSLLINFAVERLISAIYAKNSEKSS